MLNSEIRRILNEELLKEAASLNKILHALTKNDQEKADEAEIGQLIMADPTSVSNDRGEFVGKYWKWIYNQYKQGNIHEGDIPELRAALNTYNINKSQINKPIDSYNTLDELVREISQYDDNFKACRTISKGEQELEKVYEDQYVVVYIPHTWRSARKIGGDTQWCTASSNDHYFNYYLNQYGGEYYDIIRKSDGAKFQLHVESNQFMDREDHNANFACVFTTSEEAEGLIRFLESRGKDIERWNPKTWFDEVEEKLANGVRPEDVFDNVYEFQDGFARVILNSKWNFIGKKCNLLSQNLWFDKANNFDNGVAVVVLDEKFNLINPNGKLVSPNQWFDFVELDANGLANVELDGKWNWLKTNGELLSPDLWFDSIRYQENDFYIVKSDGKWNWLKTNGELLSPEQWFDWGSDFSEGVAGIEINGKCNWIDEEGKLLFPDKWFDSVGNFYGGFCAVEQNKKRNLIDKKGRLLSPEIWFDFIGNFCNGFSRVTVDEKCNWIDKSGEFLFPELWFDYCGNFSNGVARADYGGDKYLVKKDGRIFNIDTNKEIDPNTLKESKHRTIVITENMLRQLKSNKKQVFNKRVFMRISLTESDIRNVVKSVLEEELACMGSDYAKVRDLAKNIKYGNIEAIETAAISMSKKIPRGSILIPVPQHSGNAEYTLRLSNKIAELSGCKVMDILKAAPREYTLFSRKKMNGGVVKEYSLGFYVVGDDSTESTLKSATNVILIDNVVDSGMTYAQAAMAIEKAYAISPWMFSVGVVINPKDPTRNIVRSVF